MPQADRPDDEGGAQAPPVGYAAAVRAMINRDFLLTERYKGQQNRADRVGALPVLLDVERKAVKRFAKMGIPMFAHTVMRSPADQTRLYAKGVSNAKPGQSPHQYGLAFDLIHGTKGWELSQAQWDIVRHVVFEVAASCGVKLRWGGDWDGDGHIHDQRLYDPAHFELENWRDVGTKR